MNNPIAHSTLPGTVPETPARIMIITHGLYPVDGHTVSGNGIRAWSLVRGLVHHGFDIIYATPEDTVHPHTPRPEVTLLPFRDGPHLREQITALHPDVLIIGYWAYMHLLPEEINLPIVMDLLAPWMLEAEFQAKNGMQIDCLDYIQCLKRADYFMCCTWRQKAFHTAWLFLAGVNGREYPLDIIPISIDPARMPEPDNPTDKPVTFVYGGVVWPWRSPEKWITTLLELLAEKNQGTLQLIVGDYPLGNTAVAPRKPIINDDRYAGVLEQSDLLPYDEMEQMFVKADIGIELSEKNCERELSFSFRFIEYLRCGLPVICNDFLEAARFIRDYDAGWVLDSTDEKALENLVHRILSGQEDLSSKKCNARRLALEQFNLFENILPLVDFCRHPAVHEKKMRLPLPPVPEPASYASPDAATRGSHASDFSASDHTASNNDTTGSGNCLFQAAQNHQLIDLKSLFSSLSKDPFAGQRFANRELLPHQQETWDKFLSGIDFQGKTVLELGADDAAVLNKLQESGMVRGVGINNWYWHDQPSKTVKVSDEIILSWGDIRQVPFQDNSFDVILAIAVFEHIHDLDTALREMHRLLKPGGKIYSYFGPIWSCGVGHHLWFEWRGTWYRFSDPESIQPLLEPWEHLLLDREQMRGKLENNWDPETVEAFLYQIYDNDHINRYMYRDYLRFFHNSGFGVMTCENASRMDILPEIQQKLETKYGPGNDFSCGNLWVVLEKTAGSDPPVTGASGTKQPFRKIAGGAGMIYRAFVKRLLLPLFTRKGKKNLAMVTRADLFPVDHGAAAKIYHTARVLSYSYDAVYLITQDRNRYFVFRNGDMQAENFPRMLRNLLYPGEDRLREKTRTMGVPEDDAFLFFPKFDRNFRLRVLYTALQAPMAVYQAEFPFYLDACSWARWIFRGKRAVVEHNVEFQRLARTYTLSPSAEQAIREYEVRVCNAADHVITVSRNDTRTLIQAGVPDNKITMIPHGVDLENFEDRTPGEIPARQRIRHAHGLADSDMVLIFHGIYCYPPNREAADIIGSRILPSLNHRGYHPKCLAVGKYPPETTNHPDLTYTGVVDHVAPYIRAADIAVVPLLEGGGTRMKILEYFAAGIPVVATAKGAEGIEAVPGTHLIIADDPDRFADILIQLMENPDRRKQIGGAGREFVSQLDWKLIGTRYADLYEGSPVHDPLPTTGTTDMTEQDRNAGKGQYSNHPAAVPAPDREAHTDPPAVDHTGEYDYATLLQEEKHHYAKIEVTDQLTEGGKHAWSAWTYYWERIGSQIHQQAGPCADMAGYLESSVPKNRPIRVLSLGSGYCGQELILARQFSRDYEMVCTDINDLLFGRARQKAADENLHLTFQEEDLNFIRIPPGSFDMIFAHAVLHHVINLEHLFDQIARGLTDCGFLHLVEVVGENRRLLWKENQNFVNQLLNLCPDELTRGCRIDTPEEEDGMEGVRQQDILPLLRQRFETRYEFLHGAFMRFVCQHEVIGKNLDPARELSRKYLDFLMDCDANAIDHQLLRPLEVWGVYHPVTNAPSTMN